MLLTYYQVAVIATATVAVSSSNSNDDMAGKYTEAYTVDDKDSRHYIQNGSSAVTIVTTNCQEILHSGVARH